MWHSMIQGAEIPSPLEGVPTVYGLLKVKRVKREGVSRSGGGGGL